MKITELLGIEYPIIQGAMAQISKHPLVSAVSEAGGLGVIASGGMTPEQLREEIRQVREVTDKPFGVNLMLMMGRVDELVEVIIEEKVKVVTTGAGTPKRFMPKFKEAGIIVIPVVPSVKLAKKMDELGVDALIAEGTEAGGHIGRIATMPLIPQIVDAVSIPVIAAGGIGDGRTMYAAFALGASAVQSGTVFLTSEECPIPDSYKQKVLEASETSAVVTGLRSGHMVRVIANEMTNEYLQKEFEGAPQEELDKLTDGSLNKAVYDGDVDRGSLMAGQISGMFTEIRTVKDIIESMYHDAMKVKVNL